MNHHPVTVIRQAKTENELMIVVTVSMLAGIQATFQHYEMYPNGKTWLKGSMPFRNEQLAIEYFDKTKAEIK